MLDSFPAFSESCIPTRQPVSSPLDPLVARIRPCIYRFVTTHLRPRRAELNASSSVLPIHSAISHRCPCADVAPSVSARVASTEVLDRPRSLSSLSPWEPSGVRSSTNPLRTIREPRGRAWRLTLKERVRLPPTCPCAQIPVAGHWKALARPPRLRGAYWTRPKLCGRNDSRRPI
jgi:hypothetical protein